MLLLLLRVVLWAALGLCNHEDFYPSIYDKSFIRECVDTHNSFRTTVHPTAANMLHMTWDLALAKTARAWANKCTFEHSSYNQHPDHRLSPTGENLYIINARKKRFDVVSAISGWHSEVNYYNFTARTCKRVCGHYTQIVWDTTYKVGCAVVFCAKLDNKKNIENFVCNYGPAGNYPRRPYKAGLPCSKCPEGDKCVNNLCKNTERDRDNSKRYSRWYPPFEFRIVCDESCITVAVLRPLLMFIAFIIVCFFKWRYPDMKMKDSPSP